MTEHTLAEVVIGTDAVDVRRRDRLRPGRREPHVVVGFADGRTLGGHLHSGIVWPTLEVVVDETPAQLHKRFDPATGPALIDPTAERPGLVELGLVDERDQVA